MSNYPPTEGGEGKSRRSHKCWILRIQWDFGDYWELIEKDKEDIKRIFEGYKEFKAENRKLSRFKTSFVFCSGFNKIV